MKNYKLLLGLAAGLFFAGCSTDDLGNDSPTLDKDEIRYMNVAICAPGAATRADGDPIRFDQGPENEVRSIKFFFYDIDGNPTGNSVSDLTKITWSPVDASDGSESIEMQSNKQVVEVRLKKGDKLPSYVVCLINSVGQNDNNYDDTNMQDLRLKETNQIVQITDGKPYFKMNNSVYYGRDIAANKDNQRIFGTPIDATSQLFTTYEAADDADPISIHVERYAARVTVTRDADFANTAFPVHNYNLTFQPKSWAVNAASDQSYVAKRLYTLTTGGDAQVPSYTDLETTFKYWTWNDETNHRCYWGCSPSYYATNLPVVADDITDYTNGKAGAVTKDDNGKIVYLLKYYSYEQLTKDLPATAVATDMRAAFVDAATGTTLYPMENTTSSDIFNYADNPKAACPSVVLAGTYKVTKKADAPAEITDLAEGTTFYLYGHTGNEWNLYTTDMKSKLVELQTVLATDNKGQNAFRDATSSILKVVHPTKATRTEGDLIVPSRYVTLQIDPDAAFGNLYFLSSAGWTQVTTTNVEEANVRLIQTLGYAQMYQNGACYYSVPIKHLRKAVQKNADGSENKNYNKEANADGFDWKAVRPGDYGLVRNHSYTINIKSISGLATGVSDKDAPIVPPMDEDTYWVSYEINILKWAVLPTQDVNL